MRQMLRQYGGASLRRSKPLRDSIRAIVGQPHHQCPTPQTKPPCFCPMRVCALITHAAKISQILEHTGQEVVSLRITLARGLLIWDGFTARVGDGLKVAADGNVAAPAKSDLEIDQLRR